MARGEVHLFAEFDRKSLTGSNFNIGVGGDVLKMGIITNAITPSTSTADPRWGSGGTTNFSTAQVGVATAYTGPITLSGQTLTRTGNQTKFDFNDPAVAQDAAGFSDGYWGIIYDDTASGKHCIGYVDLGGPVSIVTGPMNIAINAGGAVVWTAN